jgi:hypothetical protein
MPPVSSCKYPILKPFRYASKTLLFQWKTGALQSRCDSLSGFGMRPSAKKANKNKPAIADRLAHL